MSISRLWLALVLALFCLPLFVDLGRADVQDDEAIYSFGVDRLLESGDWLAPKSSPHEDAPFLEKPPLKFWIVGLPMYFGWMPHNEFGLRFWDACFGALGFLYVFMLGTRMAGPISGTVAVLLLFVHGPLLFQHGLRTNNMEAALFLSYCGGMFHYLEWARGSRPWRHAVAVALYFVLGFMTKFVAALFLPFTLLVASVLLPNVRARFLADWRRWTTVALLALALIAPWFVYAHLRFGDTLWQIILGQHVYTRFTTFLDPAHVHPWYYYPASIHQWLADTGSELVVLGGLVLLIVQTIRRSWLDGLVILLWLVLPLTAISFGTSKLYHYAYPFLPPLALAGGFLAASALAVAPVPIARGLRLWNEYAATHFSGAMGTLRRPLFRGVLLTLAGLSIALAVTTLFVGPVRLHLGWIDFRSSGVIRPSLIAVAAGVLAGIGQGAGRAVAFLLVAAMLPLPQYRATLTRLHVGPSPLRTATECVLFVQSERPDLPRGLYLDLPDRVISHPMYYYFRRVRPWARAAEPAPDAINQYLNDEAIRRPILVWEPTYVASKNAGVAAPPMSTFTDDVLLLLPGPYGVCAASPLGSRKAG